MWRSRLLPFVVVDDRLNDREPDHQRKDADPDGKRDQVILGHCPAAPAVLHVLHGHLVEQCEEEEPSTYRGKPDHGHDARVHFLLPFSGCSSWCSHLVLRLLVTFCKLELNFLFTDLELFKAHPVARHCGARVHLNLEALTSERC